MLFYPKYFRQQACDAHEQPASTLLPLPSAQPCRTGCYNVRITSAHCMAASNLENLKPFLDKNPL